MPVTFLPSSASPGPLTVQADAALPDGVDAALEAAVRIADASVVPGSGGTRDLWEALATLAAHDVAVARAIEPHWDAVAILVQSGAPVPRGRWGVFAAEGGPDPLLATETDSGWTLSGTKPWCSLADRLDSALVTAADREGARRMFAVDLRSDRVSVVPGAWQARGLAEIPSGPVVMDAAPAEQIGDPGWYLGRPGFAWGGVGVAACWFGGAVGIARRLHEAAGTRPNPFLLAHLGRVDQLLADGRRALLEAADLADDGGADPRVTAKRVRATIATAAEEILTRAGHALGPAPLATEAAFAKRVADLQLYLRQHHAERDFESLGAAIAEGPPPW